MRLISAFLFAALAGPVLPVWAQDATPQEAAVLAAPTQKQEQRVEHLAVEGQTVRIDEVRVGGQTQSIAVQPHDEKLPAYQVQPQRGDAGIQDSGRASKGQTNRTWKILDF